MCLTHNNELQTELGVNSKIPVLACLCGLQGSGKSTYAKKLKDEFEKNNLGKKCVIVSSDQIRADYPELASDNTKVFNKVYADINYWLRQGDCVIFDATNTTIKSRRQIFQRVTEPCKKICYILNTPYEECRERLLKRNQNCDRTYNIETGENIPNPFYVPIEALEKYHKSFEIPFYEEGWNEIVITNIIDHNKSVENLGNMIKSTIGFDQHNKHHTQLLNEHLSTVANQLYGISDVLYEAGSLHDIGKLDTQTYKEGDPNAHYYNHANVGAYKVLCNYMCWHTSEHTGDDTLKIKDTLDIIFYINYHMHMYNINSDKTEKKWTAIFGPKKFNNLVILNRADKYNHAKVEE